MAHSYSDTIGAYRRTNSISKSNRGWAYRIFTRQCTSTSRCDATGGRCPRGFLTTSSSRGKILFTSFSVCILTPPPDCVGRGHRGGTSQILGWLLRDRSSSVPEKDRSVSTGESCIQTWSKHPPGCFLRSWIRSIWSSRKDNVEVSYLSVLPLSKRSFLGTFLGEKGAFTRGSCFTRGSFTRGSFTRRSHDVSCCIPKE